MADILQNLSREALATAIQESMRQAFKGIFQHWPGGSRSEEDGLTHFLIPSPSLFFNMVQFTEDGVRNLDSQIQALQAEHAGRGVPLGWMHWPNAHPALTHETLLRHGFEHAMDLVGMAVDLRELQPVPMPAGVTITEVQTAADMAVWQGVAQVAHEMGDEEAAGFCQALLGIGLGAGSPMRHYIAWLDGKPVGTSSLLLSNGVAGLYDVGTLPEVRGRGIGTVISNQPLRVARDLGYIAGVLQATPMGDPVYRRMGFQEFYRIGFYAWGLTGHH